MPTSKVKEKPLGAQLSFPDQKRLQYGALVGAARITAEAYPETFSLYRPELGHINQDYGSCVGAAHTKDAEYDENNGGQAFKGDYRWLYAMCKRIDGLAGEGTIPFFAAKIRTELGIPPAGIFNTPYTNHQEFITIPEELEEELLTKAYEHRTLGFAWANTPDEVKHAITTQKSPVSATWICPNNYFAVDSQGRTIDLSGGVGLHRTQIVGWKKFADENFQRWEVQNSWGDDWGFHGNFFIPMGTQFWDGIAEVDFINASQTSGAPLNLAYPMDDINLLQGFGADFIDPKTGKLYYKSRGLNGHPGLDMRQKNVQMKGQVYATDKGKVIYAGNRGAVLGNTIILQHDWGTSHYNHLDSGSVLLGQEVGARQKIGLQGQTGQVTGPHLHFSITINGVTNPGYGNFVDPAPYLKGAQPISAGANICFAKDPAGAQQSLVIKLSDAAHWQRIAELFHIPQIITAGTTKDIPKLTARKGFVFSNQNPGLLVFFDKMPDTNWKAVIAGATDTPTEAVPIDQI